MARPVDYQTVRAWQRLMARFERSGLSVAGFCRQAGVSIASFYYWRKRLVQLGGVAPGPELANGGAWRHSAANAAGVHRPRQAATRKAGNGARVREGAREPATTQGAKRPALAQFRPVRLVASAEMVVRLPGGTQLRVPASDTELLRSVIDTLAQADAGRAGGLPC
jgi:hypothetical protein